LVLLLSVVDTFTSVFRYECFLLRNLPLVCSLFSLVLAPFLLNISLLIITFTASSTSSSNLPITAPCDYSFNATISNPDSNLATF